MASRTIQILIDAKDRSAGAFSKARSGLKRLERSVFSLRGAIGGIGLLALAKQSAAAFAEQQQAEQLLAQAISNRSDISATALERFKAQAAELQKQTTLGDEATLSIQRQAIAMGLAENKVTDLARAAANFAAATGRDVNSAANQLIKTLGGLAGELGEVSPEIKALTAEQLKAGAAIDVLNRKFAGFAAKEAQTAKGQLKQLANAYGDLQESIGGVLTARLSAGLGADRSVIQRLTSDVSLLSENLAGLAASRAELLKVQREAARLEGRTLPQPGRELGSQDPRRASFIDNPLAFTGQKLAEMFFDANPSTSPVRGSKALEAAKIEASRNRGREILESQRDAVQRVQNDEAFAEAAREGNAQLRAAFERSFRSAVGAAESGAPRLQDMVSGLFKGVGDRLKEFGEGVQQGGRKALQQTLDDARRDILKQRAAVGDEAASRELAMLRIDENIAESRQALKRVLESSLSTARQRLAAESGIAELERVRAEALKKHGGRGNKPAEVGNVPAAIESRLLTRAPGSSLDDPQKQLVAKADEQLRQGHEMIRNGARVVERLRAIERNFRDFRIADVGGVG